ncbi:esterase [Sulfurimonas sp. SAG-AH-194-I05]|nr:YqiA/YcfP family alpha/beta fold hydrolase [Sulfurimonas sp. SAG-AH-194-I05]MDF1874668.1 esterase [Sulfurimonas sp. SAG-AH-194-I05]
MIIYIHGFGGSGAGVKSTLFRKYFKNLGVDFIAPSLSYTPNLAIQTLEELIESYENVTLIGSSLGGFYSMYLSQKYDVKAVLINPSIYPMETLLHHTGHAPSFYDESYFKWSSTHVEMLIKYTTTLTKPQNFMLLVQKDDELLDYKKAVTFVDGAKIIVEEGGNHSFVGIKNHFLIIYDFLFAKD